MVQTQNSFLTRYFDKDIHHLIKEIGSDKYSKNVFFCVFPTLVLVGCVANQNNTCPKCQPIPTVVQPKSIEIHFTPGLDCENAIIERINNSKTMDVVVYSITNPAITNSLIVAHNRGATIRVITDRSQAKGKGSLVSMIKMAGIPVLTNQKHKIEHNKFAVFDDAHIVSGSYNWTTNASKYNSENCVFFDQPNKEYSKRFEYLWNLYKQD